MPSGSRSPRSPHAGPPVYSVCGTCARAHGGVWPAGHLATWSGGRCDACNEETAVCGLNDCAWPTGLPRGWTDTGWD
jgi:hypothetical protein